MNHSRAQLVFILLLVLLVGLGFLRSQGTTDMDIWRTWTKNAIAQGPVEGFRANQADYPPLSTLILFGAYRLFGSPAAGLVAAIKLAILCFLLLTTFVFWLWTRDLPLTLLLYASTLLNSLGLAYIDIFFAPALVLALWMLKDRRWGWFGLFYALACLTKWQPLLIAPFLALYILGVGHPRRWREIEWKPILFSFLPAAGVTVAALAIYQPGPMWQAFRASLSHPYLSGNALNINWILTHVLHILRPEEFGGLTEGLAGYILTGDPAITTLPRVLFYLTYLATWVLFLLREKTFRNLLLYAIAGFFAYYTFNTGVHENHLFLLLFLAAALVWLDRSFQWVALLLGLINNANLFFFYGVDGGLHFQRPLILGGDLAVWLAVFNVAFFGYLFSLLLAEHRIFPTFRQNVR